MTTSVVADDDERNRPLLSRQPQARPLEPQNLFVIAVAGWWPRILEPSTDTDR